VETDSQSPPAEPGEQDHTQEPDSFPAEYVRQLRDENAARRVEAKEATEAAESARRAALELAVERHGAFMKEPADLLLYVSRNELVGEDGLPDEAKIKEAVLKLLDERPHLDARKPEGDIDQGRRGEPTPAFDFSRMLRDAAG
jgi:hypothetical protein